MGDGKNMPAVLLAPEHCIEPHEHRRHPIARFRMGEREQLAVRRGRMVKGYAGSQPVAFETRQVVKKLESKLHNLPGTRPDKKLKFDAV